MICKFCGKNINGYSLTCKKCRQQYTSTKPTCLPSGTQYIADIFMLMKYPSDNSVSIKQNHNALTASTKTDSTSSQSASKSSVSSKLKKISLISYFKKGISHEDN